MQRNSEEFIAAITAAQPVLYACIFSLLPDRASASDVLQETNLTLWRKATDFEEGTNFNAWACRIAQYQVLNYRRKVAREKLVFSSELVSELCSRQMERMADIHRYAEPLQHCLSRLPEEQRNIIDMRYQSGGSVKKIAEMRGTTEGAISQLLYRIRETLLNCITARLSKVDL